MCSRVSVSCSEVTFATFRFHPFCFQEHSKIKNAKFQLIKLREISGTTEKKNLEAFIWMVHVSSDIKTSSRGTLIHSDSKVTSRYEQQHNLIPLRDTFGLKLNPQKSQWTALYPETELRCFFSYTKIPS